MPPAARLEVPVQRLTCGNGLYDAELLRRIDARLFPRAVIELRDASPVGATGRYHVEGVLTFHGVNEGHLPVAEVDLRELAGFLARNRERIWTAPVATVAQRVAEWRAARHEA